MYLAQSLLTALGLRFTAARAGQPFLLVLWSADCPPCIKELAHLRQVRDEAPAMELVLIATDAPEAAAEVKRTLQRFGLEDADNWIFASGFAERLRHRIDPNWYGELPRAYFYDAQHRRVGRSGMLMVEQLQAWAASVGQAPAR